LPEKNHYRSKYDWKGDHYGEKEKKHYQNTNVFVALSAFSFIFYRTDKCIWRRHERRNKEFRRKFI